MKGNQKLRSQKTVVRGCDGGTTEWVFLPPPNSFDTTAFKTLFLMQKKK